MQDIHSEAAGTKRARLEASDFQVLDDGAPVQSMREEFPRTMRLPSHNRAAEGEQGGRGSPPLNIFLRMAGGHNFPSGAKMAPNTMMTAML